MANNCKHLRHWKERTKKEINQKSNMELSQTCISHGSGVGGSGVGGRGTPRAPWKSLYPAAQIRSTLSLRDFLVGMEIALRPIR